MVKGELIGVLVVESPLVAAFDDDDEAVLSMVATLIAQMAQLERVELDAVAATRRAVARRALGRTAAPPTGAEVQVRFYPQDGTIFLDGEYLIRGVAGRVLWSLLQRLTSTGQREFANKELRLDKSLDLPGFRDNLDTRLVLLRRSLDEREALDPDRANRAWPIPHGHRRNAEPRRPRLTDRGVPTAPKVRIAHYSIRRPLIARAITSCWISLVPSKIVWILASRCQRSTGYSRV